MKVYTHTHTHTHTHKPIMLKEREIEGRGEGRNRESRKGVKEGRERREGRRGYLFSLSREAVTVTAGKR